MNFNLAVIRVAASLAAAGIRAGDAVALQLPWPSSPAGYLDRRFAWVTQPGYRPEGS